MHPRFDTSPRDRMTFLREWAASPLRTAAVAPSGARLARLITSEIGADTGPVLELGPGTGVFTRALIERGVAPDALALVELNARFVARLRQSFPRVQVLTGSAADLDHLNPFGAGQVGAVVSGLGLLAMPDPVVEAILDSAFRSLARNGAFYQFTYGRRCPVTPTLMARNGLRAEQIGKTYRNLPPARVFKITRVLA